MVAELFGIVQPTSSNAKGDSMNSSAPNRKAFAPVRTTPFGNRRACSCAEVRVLSLHIRPNKWNLKVYRVEDMGISGKQKLAKTVNWVG